MINELLAEAKASELDQYNTRFAFRDLPEGRLCVTISYHNGGDGQVRKVDARTSWVYAGKSISRSDLEKVLSK